MNVLMRQKTAFSFWPVAVVLATTRLGGGVLVLTLISGALIAQAPVRFIENKNQWPLHLDFVSPIPGGRMAVNGSSFHYVFLDHEKLDALHHRSHEPDASSPASREMLSAP